MSEQHELYLNDILESIKKIRQYTKGFSYETFCKDALVVDAVIRNLLVIGEAAKRIPNEFRKVHSEIEWKKLAGLRDILVHEYAGIDLAIIWDVVFNKLPLLEKQIRKLK